MVIGKTFILGLLTVLGIVVLGCLLDSGFIYYKATRGTKLPFRLQLFPVWGGDPV